ncbi:hypothetical protein [Dactylosporangium sp. CA-233914]|uniref:hypothetical protein n=1 Tax=Dactylosporangium sp. CA-233914 TaxID=3239934 RepID=UPI003D914643
MNNGPTARQEHAPQGVPRGALQSFTILARAELARGHRPAAIAIMRAALLEVDPATAPPRDDVIAAAALYAGTLRPHEVADWLSLRWARYAYRSATTRYGAGDERTIAAAVLLGTVLAAYRLDTAAIDVWETVASQLTHQLDAAHLRVHAARVELAVARHAAGYCTTALNELVETRQSWTAWYGAANVTSVATLLQLAALHDACGQHRTAARRTAKAMRSYRPPNANDRSAVRLPVGWIIQPDATHASLCQFGYPHRRTQRIRAAAGHPRNRGGLWRGFLQ